MIPSVTTTYSDITPGVSQTYTNITTEASQTYTNITTGASQTWTEITTGASQTWTDDTIRYKSTIELFEEKQCQTYTDNGGIELIGLGEKAGAWGTTTNNNFSIIDRLINGVKSYNYWKHYPNNK